MSSRNSPSATLSLDGDQSYFRGWTPHVGESSRMGDQSPNTTPESPNAVLSRRKINRGNRPPLRPWMSKDSKYTGSSTDPLNFQANSAYHANSQALQKSRDPTTPDQIGPTAACPAPTSPVEWRQSPITEASINGARDGEPLHSAELRSGNKIKGFRGSSAYLNRRNQRSNGNGSSEATDSTVRENKKTRERSCADQDMAITNAEATHPESSQASPVAANNPKRTTVKACKACQKHRSVKNKPPAASPVSTAQKADNRQDKRNESRNIDATRRKSLYARAKRALGLKGVSDSTSKRAVLESTTVTHPVTSQLLERASALLKQVTEKNKGVRLTDSSSTSIESNSSIAATHDRAGQCNYSSSSSFKIIDHGKSLTTTPEPESLYTGSDGNKYVRPDMSRPDAPKYLPSEARRIHTPPLPSDDARNLRLRGFFFDYNAPTEDGDPITPRASRQPSKRLASDIDGTWFRVTPSEADAAELNTLAISIPDHLPSSPLCPRHPKHKSGGRGICMAHG